MSEPLSFPRPNSAGCDCPEETFCYDMIIVGGGVAGLSAAIYGARDGFRVLVLEGEDLSNTDLRGGALMRTERIDNFPGFPGGEGAELIEKMKEQAERFGADVISARAEHIHFSRDWHGLHRVATTACEYRTRTVILATGAVARNLNVPGEAEFYGRGVSTCATCDGFFYRDKTVAVVGGGDTAIEDAAFLTRYAAKVYLIHRREEFRAVGIELEELRDNPKAEMILSASVREVHGTATNVTHIRYENRDGVHELTVDGLFVAIGSDPATTFLRETGIFLDDEGYIETMPHNNQVRGGFPGVFAVGDAVDRQYKQAITSAGRAVEAALDARAYMLNRASIPLKDVT